MNTDTVGWLAGFLLLRSGLKLNWKSWLGITRVGAIFSPLAILTCNDQCFCRLHPIPTIDYHLFSFLQLFLGRARKEKDLLFVLGLQLQLSECNIIAIFISFTFSSSNTTHELLIDLLGTLRIVHTYKASPYCRTLWETSSSRVDLVRLFLLAPYKEGLSNLCLMVQN